MGKILVSKAYCERGYVKYGFDTDAAFTGAYCGAFQTVKQRFLHGRTVFRMSDQCGYAEDRSVSGRESGDVILCVP